MAGNFLDKCPGPSRVASGEGESFLGDAHGGAGGGKTLPGVRAVAGGGMRCRERPQAAEGKFGLAGGPP